MSKEKLWLCLDRRWSPEDVAALIERAELAGIEVKTKSLTRDEALVLFNVAFRMPFENFVKQLSKCGIEVEDG